MNRKKLIAGNHKMYTDLQSSTILMKEILDGNIDFNKAEVLIFPPFPFIYRLREIVGNSPLCLGAQDCSALEEGAYTGEVSAAMIKSLGAKYVLIGHSERRLHFGEGDAVLKEKINRALDQGLSVMYCFGEKESEYNAGTRFKVIEEQLRTVFEAFSLDECDHLQLAYEPVWAIGTGKTASAEEAEEVHLFVRDLLRLKYGEQIASGIRILYGGSVKPDNAGILLAQPNIDGLLIGGASLKSADFLNIIEQVF